MTNEEAIKKMQAVKAYMISGNPIWSVTEMGEAFDMAIEALSAETKGDLISREQAIVRATHEGAYGYISAQELAEMPSAERTGKWVERHPMRYDGKFVGADTDIIPDTRIRHLYCGECDKQMPIFEKFPYCPYCGARMVNRDAE